MKIIRKSVFGICQIALVLFSIFLTPSESPAYSYSYLFVTVSDVFGNRIQMPMIEFGNSHSRFYPYRDINGIFYAYVPIGAYRLTVSAEGYKPDIRHIYISTQTTIVDITLSPSSQTIVVAGSGPYLGNNLWEAMKTNADFAYLTLLNRGYTSDTIYYLSADADTDVDGNGVSDVDGDATLVNLEYAIRIWAEDTHDLIIYMTGHGGDGVFRISETETLKAEELDSWLDSIQERITGKVIVIYDSAFSGSFVPSLIPPDGKERIVATSSSADEMAVFLSEGTISFSYFFWSEMFNGKSFYDSFDSAKESISSVYAKAWPQTELSGPRNCL